MLERNPPLLNLRVAKNYTTEKSSLQKNDLLHEHKKLPQKPTPIPMLHFLSLIQNTKVKAYVASNQKISSRSIREKVPKLVTNTFLE